MSNIYRAGAFVFLPDKTSRLESDLKNSNIITCSCYLAGACSSFSVKQFSEKQDQNIPTWNLSFFSSLFDAGVSHEVLHIKSGMFFHLLACLVKQYQTQEILSTFTYKGREILATYPSLYKRGLFFPCEGTVSNITGQLARKREMEKPITSAS